MSQELSNAQGGATVTHGAWLCRFGWHRWTRWVTDEEIIVTSYLYSREGGNLRGPSQPATRQRRECLHCGKLQYHLARM